MCTEPHHHDNGLIERLGIIFNTHDFDALLR
jgi:hypothetical protein